MSAPYGPKGPTCLGSAPRTTSVLVELLLGAGDAGRSSLNRQRVADLAKALADQVQ